MKILLSIKTIILFTMIALSQNSVADDGCDGYDPNSAKLPTGEGCKQPKKVIKYDPDCARLYGCANTQEFDYTATQNSTKSFGVPDSLDYQ